MHDLKLIIGFAAHTVIAVLLFGLIGGAAALLDYYTKLLAGLGVSHYVTLATQGLEYFLFAIDAICFVVYVLRETWLLLRSMFTVPTAVE